MKLRDLIIKEQIGDREGSAWMKKRQHLLREGSSRNIADSVVSAEVRQVLLDAAKLLKDEPVAVIGGIAFGAYAQPRYTEDVDLILATDHLTRVMEILGPKFKKISPHAMEHKKTGAIIELVDPDWVKIDPAIVDAAVADAARHQLGSSSLGVVTVPYLIALKLDRAATDSIKAGVDQSDIMQLLDIHGYQDLSKIPIKKELRSLYEDLWKRVQKGKME